MTNDASLDLWDELMKHYQAKDYAGAYQIAQRGLREFPEDRYQLRWASMCLAARLKETELALSLFEESLQHGEWFGDEMLSNDQGDLAGLRGLPRFEGLVTRSLDMQDRARGNARPSLKILEPNSPTGPRSLLIGLYGNQANIDSAAQTWGPATDHGWTVALPQSSQISAPQMFVWNDEPKAFQELSSHMNDLSERFELDPNRKVIGGFSRGAQVAMRMVMSGAIEVRAFLAFCPSVRNLLEWKPFIDSAAELRVRGHVIAGSDDSNFAESTEDLAKEMSSAGLDVAVEIQAGLGHRFPTDFHKQLPDLLEGLVGNAE